MRIIDKNLNSFLVKASIKPWVGLGSGILRVALAIVQIVINLLIFLITLPYICCCCKRNSYALLHTFEGLTHLFWGVLEAIPGTAYGFAYYYGSNVTVINATGVLPWSISLD